MNSQRDLNELILTINIISYKIISCYRYYEIGLHGDGDTIGQSPVVIVLDIIGS